MPREGAAAGRRPAGSRRAHRDRRAHHRARQGARGQSRGRFPRSRGHRLPASELCRRSDPPLSGGLSAAWLRRTRRHLQRPPRQASRKRGQACRRPGLQRADRRHAQCVHPAQGQHVFELGHHGRLGELHRAGSRRLHRWPLPHDRQPHEPRSGRSLDGRIRRGPDRDEAAGCVLEPVHHERVLPDGEQQSAAGGDGAGGGDQDARAGRGGGPRPRVRALRESRVGRGVVAESQQPAALPRSPGQGRQGAARHRRQVGGQRTARDARSATCRA